MRDRVLARQIQAAPPAMRELLATALDRISLTASRPLED